MLLNFLNWTKKPCDCYREPLETKNEESTSIKLEQLRNAIVGNVEKRRIFYFLLYWNANFYSKLWDGRNAAKVHYEKASQQDNLEEAGIPLHWWSKKEGTVGGKS